MVWTLPGSCATSATVTTDAPSGGRPYCQVLTWVQTRANRPGRPPGPVGADGEVRAVLARQRCSGVVHLNRRAIVYGNLQVLQIHWRRRVRLGIIATQ